MAIQMLLFLFLLTSCAAHILQRNNDIIGCSEDNCLRAFENQQYASSAYMYCKDFMATSVPPVSTSGVPAFLNNCGPSTIISAISSACPCFMATYMPSTTSETPSTTPVIPSVPSAIPTISAMPSLPTQGCNHDNCLRALNNQVYAMSAYTFCNSFLGTTVPAASTTGIPDYLVNCGPTSIISAISSACPCFVATYMPSTISAPLSTVSATPSTGSATPSTTPATPSTTLATLSTTLVAPSLPAQGCNEDNCLRALENQVYMASVYTFCNSFLGTAVPAASTTGIPDYLVNCGPTSIISAMSSACPCFLATYQPSSTSTLSSAATLLSSSSTRSSTSNTPSSATSSSSSSTSASTKSSTGSISTSTEISSSSISISAGSSTGTPRTSTSGSSSSGISGSSSTSFSTTGKLSATTTTSTSSTTSASGYHPATPNSYANCMIDPNNSTHALELIDANTGISFIDVNGIAESAVNTVTGLTEYYFANVPNGPPNVFDLVSDLGLFVAVFQDGHVGFVTTSSNGQAYVSDGKGNQYVTTIWSVDCDGNLLFGILNGPQFEFYIGPDGYSLFVQAVSSPAKRGLLQVIEIALFLKDLLHARTDLGIDDPRCSDPSLVPVVKYKAPPPSYNGCGSGPFIFNSVPFVSCCNTHDLCYDNCSALFLDCNSAFATCTTTLADQAYPGSDIDSLVKRLGYERLAATFAWIVESEIGRFVFDLATSNRCACCAPGLVSCSAGCTDIQTDPKNCGACDNICGDGEVCQNGVCSNQECNGLVCGEYTACNGNEDCQCYTTADGTGFCTGSQLCAGLAGCGSNADCGSGEICAVESCCERNVCLPINCGNPAASVLLELSQAAMYGNATSAQPARNPVNRRAI